ncbi:APC family permease [Ramlibacter sp.]|uniref:APC family permease n=1 Tax=Ramlibacter sp. TaxID=1917967 RepID=UPI0018228017|nr:APC family permease [Ramlibacter sp.]MBA2676733.1 APC family permease [Ramlibacter sp.]
MHTPSARKPLELLEYVAISAGMAVAASCYMVLGLLAGAHTMGELVFVIVAAGAMCLLFALAIGEMSARLPSAPGIRTYLKRAFGDRVSLFFTYVLLLVIPLVAAVEIRVFLAALFPGASLALQCAGATVLVGFLAGLNVAGRDLPRTAQTVVFCALVALSFSFSALGLVAPAPAAVPAAADPAAASLAHGVGLAFFLYVGFEWVAPMARSPEAAQRAVPWSMVIAVLLVGAMYLSFGMALKRMLPPAVLATSGAPHVVLGEQLLGVPGRWALQGLSLFALLTTLNAGLMGASRLVYGLAREQALGRHASAALARVSGQGIPAAAILALAGCSLLTAFWVIAGDRAAVVAGVGAGLYTFVYGAFAASHLKLRKLPGRAPGFRARVPGPVYLVLAALAAGVAAATLADTLRDNLAGWSALFVFACAAALLSHRVAKGKSARAAATQAV